MTTEGTAAAKSDPAAAPGTGTGDTKNDPVSGLGRSLTKPEKTAKKTSISVGKNRRKKRTEKKFFGIHNSGNKTNKLQTRKLNTEPFFVTVFGHHLSSTALIWVRHENTAVKTLISRSEHLHKPSKYAVQLELHRKAQNTKRDQCSS